MKIGLWGLILISILSSGCIKARKPVESEQEGATFGVGRVTAQAKIGQRGPWQIPTSLLYDMTACFQDLATVTSLRGAEFQILGGEKEITTRTNQEGCAVWTEELQFQPFMPSHFIKFSRTIKGLGTQTGIRTIDFAANPWDGLTSTDIGSRLMDLRFEKLADGKVISEEQSKKDLVSAQANSEGAAKLLVDTLRMTIQQLGSSQSQPVVSVDLTTNLNLVITDRFNKKVSYGLVFAEASLEMYLGYRVGLGQPQLLTPYNTPIKVNTRFENGGLKGRTEFKLAKLPSSGEMLIFVRVIPKNTPATLKNYEGMFSLGDSTAFSGSAFGQLVASNSYNDEFSIQKTVTGQSAGSSASALSSAGGARVGAGGANTGVNAGLGAGSGANGAGANSKANDTEGGSQASLRTIETYTLSPLTFQFSGYRSDETAGQRTVVYKMRTSIKNTITGAPVLLQKITVIKSSGESIQVMSTDSGFVEWTEELKHQYYDREKFFERQVTLKSQDGYQKTLKYFINPWDSGATFGFDERMGKNLQLLNAEVQARKNSTVALMDFGYQSQSLRYNIDQYLNMSVKKSLIFNFSPKAIRSNSLSKGKAAIEDLRDGVYVLRAALQKKYFENISTPVEFISVVERLVRVQQGRLNVPLEFEIKDLRLMRTRLNFLVEIAPVNEKLYPNPADLEALKLPFKYQRAGQVINRSADLKARTFVGPIVIGHDGGGGPLRPTDQLDENLCAVSDCNSIAPSASAQNLSFTNDELAQYSQSVKSLKNETLNQLILRSQKINASYDAQMKKASSLSRYLVENNLEYAQLKDPAQMVRKVSERDLSQTNRIFKAQNPIQSFLSAFNKPMKASNGSVIQTSGSSEILSLITSGQYSPVSARRLCRLMLEDIYFENQSSLGRDLNNGLKSQKRQLLNLCYKAGVERKLDHFFSFNKIIRSENLSSFEEGMGKWVNFNVGTQVYMGFAKGHSDSKTVSGGFNISGMAYDLVADTLKKIPIVGAIAKGVTFTVSQSRTESLNYNAGSSAQLSSGIALAVQQKSIKLNFSKLERCLTTKISSAILESLKIAPLLLKRWPKGDVSDWMSRGLMICSGEYENKKQSRIENYYYFSQYFSSGDMLDDGDLKNNPWLLMIRGDQDYNKVLAMMDVRDANYSNVTGQYGTVSKNSVPTNFDLSKDSILRLDRAFEDRSPSYPGLLIVK